MRNRFQKNDGFTLVELMVTIITGSIVTLAAVTILLLGVRINKQSTDTASRQTTTRILLSSLEDLATEGTITKVTSELASWKVFGTGNAILYSYDAETRTIYAGGTEDDKSTDTDESVAGKPVMEGVIASDVMLEGQLLTFTVEMEDGTYASSVYCRTAVDAVDEETDQILSAVPEDSTDETEVASNVAFLQALASQYAIKSGNVTLRNPGLILVNGESDGIYYSNGIYYSQWYITSTGGKWGENGWNANTPWCACFISWGLNQVLGNDAPCFANVDSFMNYLKNSGNDHRWEDSRYYDEATPYVPRPGDLIFFDWTVDSVRDPAHIGAVIKKDGDYVYTIEGNSANRVAVRKYSLNDPRIIGYGALEWPTTS